MRRSLPAVLALSGAALLLGGCADSTPTEPGPAPVATNDVRQLWPAASPTTTSVPDVEVRTGRTGPGALYALFRPANWNGRLVVYAHGYVSPALPVALPQIDPLRDALLGAGFAVAYSSYSENGYAVKDGVIRTRQLPGLFAAAFGDPVRTLVVGHSLGGVVALALAEQSGGLFDGALAMCGFLGGGQMELDYVWNTRLLFGHYFPGVIPGDAMSVDPALSFEADVLPRIVQAIGANPMAAVEVAGIEQVGIRYHSGEELATSLASALWFHWNGVRDVLDRTHGRSPFDNTSTVYAGSSDDAALNAAIARYTGSPDAEAYVDRYFTPTGRPRVPLVTLHTTRDPVVPFAHQTAYGEIAAAAGGSGMVLQRSVDAFGHCTFGAADQLAAFGALVQWVETGMRPDA